MDVLCRHIKGEATAKLRKAERRRAKRGDDGLTILFNLPPITLWPTGHPRDILEAHGGDEFL